MAGLFQQPLTFCLESLFKCNPSHVAKLTFQLHFQHVSWDRTLSKLPVSPQPTLTLSLSSWLTLTSLRPRERAQLTQEAEQRRGGRVPLPRLPLSLGGHRGEGPCPDPCRLLRAVSCQDAGLTVSPWFRSCYFSVPTTYQKRVQVILPNFSLHHHALHWPHPCQHHTLEHSHTELPCHTLTMCYHSQYAPQNLSSVTILHKCPSQT